MRVDRSFVWSLVVVLIGAFGSAAVAAEVRHEIHFPDLPGYVTLKCDFHMHTIFSDGEVWPTVRVEECWREGLDAMAITDHIENQPHKADVPTKHNRSYELAAKPAQEHGLLLIRAAEITRNTPPGHFNAIFLKDAEPLAIKDFVEAVGKANEQGAFVFWNHQGWQGEEKGRWMSEHTTIYERHWLHGMEICNNTTYYPTAHRWCLEKNLTMLGSSDIHEPDLRTRSTPDDHRPMTLVFAKQRTPEALKEALMTGRTVVWFNDQLIGRREWLAPLFQASVQVGPANSRSGRSVWVSIYNQSDVRVVLKRSGKVGPQQLDLSPSATTLVKVTADGKGPLELQYTAENFLVGPDEGLPVTLKIAGQ